MNKSDFDAMNDNVIREFRAHNGKVAGRFEGQKVLLMHHQGAKSGKAYLNPLVYSEDGDRYVLVASRGGAPKHPDWYHNLIAHPDIEIEVGSQTIPVRVEEVEGEERQRLFDQHAELMPYFREYAKATQGIREIPVLVLKRR